MTNQELAESILPTIKILTFATNTVFTVAMVQHVLNMPMSDFKKAVTHMGYTALLLTSSHILAASNIVPGFNDKVATPAAILILMGGTLLWQLPTHINGALNSAKNMVTAMKNGVANINNIHDFQNTVANLTGALLFRQAEDIRNEPVAAPAPRPHEETVFEFMKRHGQVLLEPLLEQLAEQLNDAVNFPPNPQGAQQQFNPR